MGVRGGAARRSPCQILRKERQGDYEVDILPPDVTPWQDHQPVLVDDIVSSGRTLLATLEHLRTAGMPRATCIAVHGLFAGDAYERLQQKAEVLTTDTVPHPSNAISVANALASACREWLGKT
ncbi:phosphoribosyltransferase family protein [Marinobacterium aestuariivivens]|uniref:ribose-phosphate diphosphokinase n=1 Tax=Marinobacterium aestuariivivens TaxID=1698799 RepID=A0ABW1ZW57_9GAMM